jgi:AcrR family transcriptional regulator
MLYSMAVETERQTKGERTRTAILDQAARLATVDGLEGLTIGHLALATSMSKSGLYAHFGSKQELQLATIDAARATFVNEVLRPALRAPRGIRRLIAACDAYLSHIERRVFPGGCFFSAAAADVGTRRGPVRDAIATQQREWIMVLERLAREAIALGELSPEPDPAQLAFELKALLVAANNAFILLDDPNAFGQARLAISQRLHTPTSQPPTSP